MKEPMTIEEACKLAINALQFTKAISGEKEDGLHEAVEILRNMAEEPVEKIESGHHACKCRSCSVLYVRTKEISSTGVEVCPNCSEQVYRNYDRVIAKKVTTQTRTLQIVDVVSDVKFEEVD